MTAVVSEPAAVEGVAELPSYLRRASNGVLELVLHPTEGQVWNVCQMKHQLRYGWRIERAQPRPALNYGGALHAALAFRYQSPATADLAAIQACQMALLEKWFAAHSQPEDEWRNLGRAQQAITAYNEAYPSHDWQVVAVEEGPPSDLPGSTPHPADRMVGTFMAGGEPVRLLLRLRKDLIVARNKELWIVDHKTASEWGDDPDKNQSLLGDRRSFQFRAYTWDERERQRLGQRVSVNLNDPDLKVLPVRGVLANYLVGRRNYSDNPAFAGRRTANPKPRDQFVQWPYPYSDAALDEWQEEALSLGEEIVRAWQLQRWRQAFDRSCSHYGRCEFYDYCDADPSDRESVLSSSLFQGRDEAAEPEVE